MKTINSKKQCVPPIRIYVHWSFVNFVPQIDIYLMNVNEPVTIKPLQYHHKC
jgi:hypothetical protein